MNEPHARNYRAEYLKLRSVLFDRTTGLPAFPVLFDQLRALLDGRRELGVVHLEIANLDRVEALYGWQVFDRIVARVADTLREGLGKQLPQGALVALNGVAGDRFVAFVPDCSELAEIGPRLCRRLERGFEDDAFSGLNPALCFRSGHALLADNPFYRFERCVYAAVEEARRFHDRRERRRELSWGEELQRIIQSGDVETVFQPVVELDGGRVIGHEAFVRGPLDSMFETPRAMFALSMRMGVAPELDRLCCEAALRGLGELAGQGKLFVNLLPASLDGPWLESGLGAALREAKLARADVVVEISERGAKSGPDPFVERVRRVKQRGFGLALDDVGTGATDLAAIESLEPDYLKLDVSLVHDIHQNLIQQEILDTLVRLAERIGAAVIAEGVESEDEAATLARAGARYGQGYLYAVPAPASTRRPRPRGSS